MANVINNVKCSGLEELFTGLLPISGPPTGKCIGAIKSALDEMSPDRRHHLIFMIYYVALLTRDVMEGPEDFVEEHVAGIMIGLMNPDDVEVAVN